MAGVEEWLKKEIQQIRTSQASPAILDAVKVESYGAPVGIKELAAITVEGARTIRITPWDKSQAKEIEKAIAAANLGVSVVADDQGLRVNFPDLTSERRTAIAKIAKEKMEESKKQVRSHRDVVVRDLQAKEKAGTMGKDDTFRGTKDVQKIVDDTNKKLEEAYTRKEKEIVG